MAGKSPNMKVNVTADNSDLNKKMKESKAAVKDFEKVGSDALSAFGNMIGVDVQKLELLGSAAKGLGTKLEQSGNTGAQAFAKMLGNISALQLGIAGLGIAGAVAAFKALKSEAEAFKNTVQGANIELQTQAYVSTYKQFVHDLNQSIGEGAANAESGWKKFWGTLGSDFKLLFTTPGGFGTTEGLDQVVKAQAEAQRVAQSAADITNGMYQVQRQISDKTVEWARMEAQIAEYKRIAYDKTQSTATQQEALKKTVELINQRYQEEADLRTKLADLQEQYNNLVSSSADDLDKANQLRVTAEQTTIRMNNALRELSERQNTVTQNAEKEAAARKEAAEAAAKIAQSRADLAAWDSTVSGNLQMPTGATALTESGIAVPVTPVLDTSSIVDITQELQMVMTSAFESIGTSVGALIGDLATGGDAWANFSNSAISAFGDMAIAVGKMAIQTGVATLGIKAALESLNGYVAIAAGVALVALGTAVKQGMGNIASGGGGGGYSASTYVASSGYGTSNNFNNFERQEVEVKVTGTIRGEGSQLVSVIENEQIRKNHTT